MWICGPQFLLKTKSWNTRTFPTSERMRPCSSGTTLSRPLQQSVRLKICQYTSLTSVLPTIIQHQATSHSKWQVKDYLAPSHTNWLVIRGKRTMILTLGGHCSAPDKLRYSTTPDLSPQILSPRRAKEQESFESLGIIYPLRDRLNAPISKHFN